MNWKTSSPPPPHPPMQQAGYKAFIKGWEKLPTLQCHQLFNPAPQIWLIPKYISSHISLPYFITHVDFQYSFLMPLVSTHKTHWLGWPTHPSLSRTFVVWALKLMHPEKPFRLRQTRTVSETLMTSKLHHPLLTFMCLDQQDEKHWKKF